MATPIYCDEDKIDPLQDQYKLILRRTPNRPDQDSSGIYIGSIPQPRHFGIEASSSSISPSDDPRWLRLYRNGHFEFYEDISRFTPDNWPQTSTPINSLWFAHILLHFLRVAKGIYEVDEVSEPLSISLIFGYISNTHLQPWQNHKIIRTNDFVWKENELVIDLVVNDLFDLAQIASFILDRLFNAYGYESNGYMDEQGNII